MIRLLFICPGNAGMSQIAEGFAKERAGGDFEVFSAGVDVSPVLPFAVELMHDVGIDISQQRSKEISSLSGIEFDLVITLCDESYQNCPILAGKPPLVNWNLPVPDEDLDEIQLLNALRSLREHIRELVNNLFDHGYLSALAQAKSNVSMILDNISDAIIAHDMNRKVFYFNKAAEKLTGYSREEVLNTDCHDVFPHNFCGAQCSFCDEKGSLRDNEQKTISFTCKDGTIKFIELTMTPIVREGDGINGVIVYLRDLTPYYKLTSCGTQVEGFNGIVGVDPKMIDLMTMVKDVAASKVPVYINGETGTGKELIANAVHEHSPRKGKLFVPINCGALPENLLESELFGYVKGAFTGATRDKKGRFEIADGGTIFLDEIGDISPSMQVKLLRVLQEGTFEPIGSEVSKKVDVRIISATHKELSKEIKAGRFRQDLFYRIGVVPLKMPPLRERRSDIPLLAEFFVNKAAVDSGRNKLTLSHEVVEIMLAYKWPGNIREMQNWIQYALVKCKGKLIRPEHLPQFKSEDLREFTVAKKIKRTRRKKLNVGAVKEALQKSNGNKVKAAKSLGVGRATLYRFIDDNIDCQL